MTSTTAAPPARRPLELRLLIGVLYAVPAVALLGFGLVYVAGLIEAGSHAALVGTPVDPKDAIPFGPHFWNPFFWLYAALALVLGVGWVFAALAGLAALGSLAVQSVRADRRTVRHLVAGVLCSALLLTLMFHPATLELRHWWAD